MKKIIASYVIGIVGLFFMPTPVAAQEFVENITRFFEFDVGKRYEDSTKFTSKVVLAPVASYEPSTSLGLGVGAKFLFKFAGSGLETRTSNIPLSLTYTFRNQFIFYSGYTVFLIRKNIY